MQRLSHCGGKTAWENAERDGEAAVGGSREVAEAAAGEATPTARSLRNDQAVTTSQGDQRKKIG
jgi:hypothetical protein